MKHSIMNLVVFILTSYCMLSLPAYGQAPNLLTKQDGKFYKVEILLDGEDILTSPPEGLWSIATAWKQDWPADWVHGKPTEIEHIGDWTILRGKLETSAGTWRISDSYRPEGDVVKCIRRFIWEGKETANFVTLSVRFQCRGKGSAACLPGILYHVIHPAQRAAEYLFTQANPPKKPFLRNIVFLCHMPAWNGMTIMA